MDDFDLSQALDDSIEEPRRSCCSVPSDSEGSSFSYDLQLVISCNHKTMGRVATLVMANNRWRSLLDKFRNLSDRQRCNMVLERLMEERTIEMLKSNAQRRVYQRVNSVNECTLRDVEQKDVIHATGELKLHAITLKGGNCEQKVKFQMSRYSVPEDSAKGQPVVLSIANRNLHLTSSMQDGKAVLNLEPCVSGLQNISSDQDMTRFLFYKSTTGMSMTMFESMSCEGWYISTSSEDDESVEMCQADSAASRLTNFCMSRV